MRPTKLILATLCSAALIGGPIAAAAEQGRGRGHDKQAQGTSNGQKNKDKDKHKDKDKDKDKADTDEDRGSGNEAHRFGGLDQNNDGIITRAEWRGDDTSFRNQDWNRDGVISGDERRPGAARPDWVERYISWDANRDNTLSRAEWRGTAADFARWDTNRNGVLTAAELGIRR